MPGWQDFLLQNHGENKHLWLKAPQFMLACYGSPMKPTQRAKRGRGRKGEWKSSRALSYHLPLRKVPGSCQVTGLTAHWTEWGMVTPGKETFILDFPVPNSNFYDGRGSGKIVGFLKLTWMTSTMASFLQCFFFFPHLFEEFIQVETCSSKSLYFRVIS